jgi:hypothetical protein
MFEIERTKQESKESNTFENREKPELKTPCREELFCENASKLFENARKR